MLVSVGFHWKWAIKIYKRVSNGHLRTRLTDSLLPSLTWLNYPTLVPWVISMSFYICPISFLLDQGQGMLDLQLFNCRVNVFRCSHYGTLQSGMTLVAILMTSRWLFLEDWDCLVPPVQCLFAFYIGITNLIEIWLVLGTPLSWKKYTYNLHSISGGPWIAMLAMLENSHILRCWDAEPAVIVTSNPASYPLATSRTGTPWGGATEICLH